MADDVLNSWKEIAAYIGRGIRTVQRWEQELQLPVHRPRSKERSAVMGLRSELDAWLACTPIVSPGIPQMREEILEKRLILLRIETKRVEEQIRRLRKNKENQAAKAG